MQQEHRWVLHDLRFMDDTARVSGRETKSSSTGQRATAAARYQSGDRTGSIEVTVDSRGGVHDVDVLDDWREHMEPADFPKALYQAYILAMRQAEAARVLVRSPARPEPPLKPAIPLELSMPQTPEQRALWLNAVSDALDEIERRSAKIAAVEAASRVVERSVAGPGGYLTVHLRGGSVVGISGSAQRIESAQTELLRHEAQSLLRKHGFRFETE